MMRIQTELAMLKCYHCHPFSSRIPGAKECCFATNLEWNSHPGVDFDFHPSSVICRQPSAPRRCEFRKHLISAFSFFYIFI